LADACRMARGSGSGRMVEVEREVGAARRSSGPRGSRKRGMEVRDAIGGWADCAGDSGCGN
jgi:hypothetical protein